MEVLLVETIIQSYTFICFPGSLEKPARFQTKIMSKICARFQTKTTLKPHPLEWHNAILFILEAGEGRAAE